MQPYYQDDWCTIYHGDCQDVLPELPPVNALITDPPYGINWSRATWDDSPTAYPTLMKWLVCEASRLVPLGWCFVFQAMPNVSHFHEWFPDGWRLFAACKNFAQVRPTGIWSSWDPVVIWFQGDRKQQYRSPAATGTINRDYHIGNVSGIFADKTSHPCRRPLDTLHHIIEIAVQPNATLIDPFLGSGTTLRAAKDLGRKSIGIEINERYCEIAARRLGQEVLPLWKTA